MMVSRNDLKVLVVFTVLIMLQERLFYTIDRSLVIVISILGLLALMKNYYKTIQRKYSLGILILSFICIQLYGIFIAYFKFGQSPITGLIGAHYIFIYGFYFVFVDWFRKGNTIRKLDLVKKAFIFFGVLFSILLIIQSLIYPTVIFHLTYASRNGLRIQGCHIVQFSFVVAVCDTIYSFRLRKIIPIIIMGYELLFINKSRNVVILMAVIILFLFYRQLKENSIKKFFVAILLFPIIVLVFWNMGIGDMVSDIIFELQSVNGTSGIRIKELTYYFNLLKESKYLGIGILGDRFPLRSIIYGTNIGYYMEDIGVSAFIFKTGILGLLWLIFYLKKIGEMAKYKCGWIKLLAVFIFLKTIFSMFFSVSFLFDIRDGLIYLVILLAMIDATSNQKMDEEGVE